MTAAVHLLAGGPGDPGLWTVRAEGLLAVAAAVVCDRVLVGAVSPLVGPATAVVAVDDEHEGADHVVTAARRHGAGVVRLAAGDRLVWEAGGAEAAALRAAGIDHEVVPAVVAAFAGPAGEGVPVMARPLVAALTVAVATPAPVLADTTVVTQAGPDDVRPVVTGAVTTLDLTGRSARDGAAP